MKSHILDHRMGGFNRFNIRAIGLFHQKGKIKQASLKHRGYMVCFSRCNKKNNRWGQRDTPWDLGFQMFKQTNFSIYAWAWAYHVYMFTHSHIVIFFKLSMRLYGSLTLAKYTFSVRIFLYAKDRFYWPFKVDGVEVISKQQQV